MALDRENKSLPYLTGRAIAIVEHHQKTEMERQEVRQRIGDRIAELRKEQGLSVRDLAERSGVNYVTISKIENGKFNVGLDVLSRIASALGMEVNIVMSEIK